MRGTKRLAVSDSTTDNTNSFSKKMMAESSPPKAMGSSFLDICRAELSKQHVRALNIQFASWVQTQLQNHPDELWEDGVRDYLTHASNIMHRIHVVFSIQSSFSFGGQSSISVMTDASNNADDDDAAEQPSSPSLKKTKEAGPQPVFSNSGFANPWSSGPGVHGENLLEHSQKKLATGSKDNVKKVSFQENTFSAPPASGTTSMFSNSSFTNSFSASPPSGTASTFSTSSLSNSFSAYSFGAPSASGTTSMFSTSSFSNSFSTGSMLSTRSSFSFGRCHLGVPLFGTKPVSLNSGFANPWSSWPDGNGENQSEHSQKKPATGSKDNTKKVSFQENTFSTPPAASGTTSMFSTSSVTAPSGTTSKFSTSSFTNSFSAPPPSGTTSAFSTSDFTNSFSASPPSGTTSTFSTTSFPNSFSAPPPSGMTSMISTSSFTNLFSTGSMFSTQSSFSSGGQSSISVKTDTSNNADEDDAAVQPSSPSLKKTEEAGILVAHEVKCKLYVKSNDPEDKDTWKDRGIGQLSIKCKEGVTKGTKDSKPTVLVRNDVGRLLLNALLYPGIKTSLQKNSIVAIFHSADDNGSENSTVVARMFMIRTKSQEDRDKLAAAIKEYAPAA